MIPVLTKPYWHDLPYNIYVVYMIYYIIETSCMCYSNTIDNKGNSNAVDMKSPAHKQKTDIGKISVKFA